MNTKSTLFIQSRQIAFLGKLRPIRIRHVVASVGRFCRRFGHFFDLTDLSVDRRQIWRSLDFSFLISDFSQFWILNSEFWILNSQFWILNSEFSSVPILRKYASVTENRSQTDLYVCNSSVQTLPLAVKNRTNEKLARAEFPLVFYIYLSQPIQILATYSYRTPNLAANPMTKVTKHVFRMSWLYKAKKKNACGQAYFPHF